MENTIFDTYFEKSNGEYKDPLLFLLEDIWKAAENNGKNLNPYAKPCDNDVRMDFERIGRVHIQRCIAIMELKSHSPASCSLKFAQELADKSGLIDLLFDKI